jgi:hypothetical protein
MELDFTKKCSRFARMAKRLLKYVVRPLLSVLLLLLVTLTLALVIFAYAIGRAMHMMPQPSCSNSWTSMVSSFSQYLE